MTAKLLIAIAMSGTMLYYCTGCATRQQSTAGLSKEQVTLERERIAEAREVRKERWWAFAETVGKAGVNVGVTWLQRWLEQGSDGLSKDR